MTTLLDDIHRRNRGRSTGNTSLADLLPIRLLARKNCWKTIDGWLRGHHPFARRWTVFISMEIRSKQELHAHHLKRNLKSTTPDAPRLVFSDGRRRSGRCWNRPGSRTGGHWIPCTRSRRGSTRSPMNALIRPGPVCAVRLVNRIINLNCRNRMTAGLHGQVVADSYAENLKQKGCRSWPVSEEKYRHLAENLEIEVEKKTRDHTGSHSCICCSRRRWHPSASWRREWPMRSTTPSVS